MKPSISAVYRAIPQAPDRYDGTLACLFDEHLQQVFPPPEEAARLHELIASYVARPNPLFLIRNRGTDRRGEVIALEDGTRICQTDNSPAWWMHHLAFQRIVFATDDEFACAVENAPCHFHANGKAGTAGISRAGWYVAHLLPAKPTGSRHLSLDRPTVAALFVRNVHPMNHFYLPNRPRGAARTYEGRPDVLSYIARRLKARYGEVWDQFVALAGLGAARELAALPLSTRDIPYLINPDSAQGVGQVRQAPDVSRSVPGGSNVKVRYSRSRLWFQADLIEPLQWDDSFQVDTPDGSFVFTKREFYEVFANVVATDSYNLGRHYHTKTPPSKAMPFKLA